MSKNEVLVYQVDLISPVAPPNVGRRSTLVMSEGAGYTISLVTRDGGAQYIRVCTTERHAVPMHIPMQNVAGIVFEADRTASAAARKKAEEDAQAEISRERVAAKAEAAKKEAARQEAAGVRKARDDAREGV